MDAHLNLNFSLPSPKLSDMKFDPSLFEMEISQPNNTCCISNNHYNKRREIISFILQLSYKLDPFLSYLAIDYLHRFISNHPIVNQGSKPWILRLLAVSCVSLALKMGKTKAVSLNNIQHEGGVMFDKKSVRRMELLILGSLRWQMRPITPFCFLSFFLSFSQLKHPPLKEALRARATQIICNLQQEMKIWEFRPSIVAASALLSASHELFPLQFSSFKDSISTCSYVNKADLSKCNEVMEELATESCESMLDMLSSSNTPVNVLDGECSSSSSDYINFRSDETTVNAEACGDFKRRKISIISNFRSDETFQLAGK